MVIPEQLPKELKKISSSIAFYSMTGKAKKNYSGITVCQIRSMVDFCCSSLTQEHPNLFVIIVHALPGLAYLWLVCEGVVFHSEHCVGCRIGSGLL